MILHDSPFFCFYCEIEFKEEEFGTNKRFAQTKDHIIPISRGGGNVKSNMVYCCSPCNHLKSSLTLPEFIFAAFNKMVLNNTYKGIGIELYPIIIENATLLIEYVKEQGNSLYRYNNVVSTWVRPKQMGEKNHGGNAGLSVNTNTIPGPKAFIGCRLFKQKLRVAKYSEERKNT